MKQTMSREEELIWAIEVQQECLRDLKGQIGNKEEIIQLQQTLLAIREIEIEKLKKQVQQLQMETNWKWN